MSYCSSCGEKIAEDANFCPRCGTKTPKGRSANVLYPTDRLTDAFYSVGLELEKALKLAARETDAAFRKARENLQTKPAEQTVACSKCSSKNQSGAVFCTTCGSKVAPTEASHDSGSK